MLPHPSHTQCVLTTILISTALLMYITMDEWDSKYSYRGLFHVMIYKQTKGNRRYRNPQNEMHWMNSIDSKSLRILALSRYPTSRKMSWGREKLATYFPIWLIIINTLITYYFTRMQIILNKFKVWWYKIVLKVQYEQRYCLATIKS